MTWEFKKEKETESYSIIDIETKEIIADENTAKENVREFLKSIKEQGE